MRDHKGSSLLKVCYPIRYCHDGGTFYNCKYRLLKSCKGLRMGTAGRPRWSAVPTVLTAMKDINQQEHTVKSQPMKFRPETYFHILTEYMPVGPTFLNLRRTKYFFAFHLYNLRFVHNSIKENVPPPILEWYLYM